MTRAPLCCDVWCRLSVCVSSPPAGRFVRLFGYSLVGASVFACLCDSGCARGGFGGCVAGCGPFLLSLNSISLIIKEMKLKKRRKSLSQERIIGIKQFFRYSKLWRDIKGLYNVKIHN